MSDKPILNAQQMIEQGLTFKKVINTTGVKSTEKYIVAALAGELMSVALRVSMSAVPDVFVSYHPHCGHLDFSMYVNGWGREVQQDIYEIVELKREGAAEKLHCLIMKVEALGEVSK